MWKIIKWPIIYIIVQFLLLFLMSFYYVSQGNDPNLFSEYLVDKKIFLVIGLVLIFLPILIVQYKKQKIEEKKISKISNWLFIIFIGIILSLFYNTLSFYINDIFSISNLYDKNNQLLITILSAGLLGPIIEELLFRGIMYNEAKSKMSNMKSILLINTIFAICHTNIFQIIYAFGLGFILIYVYEKYKTIKAPIILHIASNMTTTLFVPLLIKNNILFNYSIFFISLLLIVFYWFKYIKK